MATHELFAIGEQYPPAVRDDVLKLAAFYRRRNEREVLELTASAADLSTDQMVSLGLNPDPDPQLLEAFQGQYPNVDVESLAGRSGEELQGFVNGVKGKYFEVLVRDRLNSGESLGGLALEPGQVARLAEAPTQAGWDLEIVDQQGESIEQIQLKATDSLSYVKDALVRYPDIRVAVPEDIDSYSDAVIGTDISHDVLEQATQEQLAELSEGAITNALETAAEMAVDIVPVTSALLIGVTEGRKYLMGQATLLQATKVGGRKLARAGIYNALGAALSAAGLGPFGIPIVLAVRVGETRLSGQVNLGDNLATRAGELNGLALSIQEAAE